MKKKMVIMLVGTMLIATLLTGCGGTGQQASEQTVGSTESRQEPSQPADEQ